MQSAKAARAPRQIENLNARNRDVTSKADQVDLRTRGPFQDIGFGVQNKEIDLHQVLKFYGRGAIKAHKATNWLTEVMILEAHEWINSGEINLKGPLAG
jgi:hypothetical protein